MTSSPLLERFLDRLPGPRLPWVIGWGILTLCRPLIFASILEITGSSDVIWTSAFLQPRLFAHIVLAYMVIFALLVGRKFAEAAQAIEPAVLRLTEGRTSSTASVFRGIDSVWGPLGLTLLLTLFLSVQVAQRYGVLVALLLSPVTFVLDLPLMALFWGYNVLLLGLDRLGRRKLALDPFPEDLSLGLRPVGALAALGFWAFCAETVPFLILSLRAPEDFILGLVFFVAGVILFFLSLTRIHRQMVAAKQHYLERARKLYAEAFEPVKMEPTLATLQSQAPLLSAAEALEKRTAAIQEWPFDERVNSRVVAIVTAAVVAIITRILLRYMGI